MSNLLVARGVGRRREVAVRTALGAGRARLIRQLLTESLVLALLGGAAGALLAVWGAEALVALSAGTLPRSAEAGVDARVLLFALAASLATAAVSGLWPALRATTAADGETLREGHGSAGLPRGAARARRALLIVELALTMVLLAGAVLLLRSMAAVLRVDPGFRAAGALTARLELPEARYPDRAQQAAFYRDLQSRLAALPGVAAAGTSNFAPLSGSRWTLSTKFLDHPVPAGDEASLEYRVAGGEFFRAAGIPLKRGRFFTAEDRADAPLVAIITEAAAHRHFPAEDPIGRQIIIGDRVKEPRRIIGVVGDVLEGGLTEPAAPELYVPADQVPWSGMAVIVRADGDPMRLVPVLRAVIASLDRSLPVEDIGRLSDAVSRSLGERRFALTLLSAFSVLALILAAVGIYGHAPALGDVVRRRPVGPGVLRGRRDAPLCRGPRGQPHSRPPRDARQPRRGASKRMTTIGVPMIEMKNVEKSYDTKAGQTFVLRRVNLNIAEGEFVTVMGPSGAGKSTLLSILGMLDHAWTGEYRLLENAVHGLKPKERIELNKKYIGFVFQQYHLLDNLTVAENIDIPLSYRNVRGSERAATVADTLDRFQIVGKKDLYPSQLSGGQQQLVGVARALVAKPRLLLADEPTGNLHSDQGREIMRLFQKLNDEGMTIVQVTHSEENARYGHRIVRLRDGWIAGDEKVTDRIGAALTAGR